MRFHIYDMHTHTDCSHDSTQLIDELCHAEIVAGCRGIAVTNHSDTPYSHENGDFARLERSIREAKEAAVRYAGQLEVLCGVELGEELWARKNACIILDMEGWDVILASVHGQVEDGRYKYYGSDPYDLWPQAKLDDFLRRYLEDMAETAALADYDVLTHLDCPVRYINGRCHREADVMQYRDLVDEILRSVIRRDKTLEVNTSGLNSGWGHTMPEFDVVMRYRELGGQRICVGSDAHTSVNAGKGLEGTVEHLLTLGFEKQTIYQKRCPVEIPFQGQAMY